MNRVDRTLFSILGIVAGLLCMGAAYDKPVWYMETLGTFGMLLVIASIAWWIRGFFIHT